MSKKLKPNVVANSRLDYYESPTVQVVNKHPSGFREHTIINSLEVDPIQFTVIGNSRETINFSQHYLYVKYNIVNAANGQDLPAGFTGHFGTINNCLHSLFKHVTVQINGITVTPSSDYYPLHAYFTTLFSASKENVNTLKLGGWFRDVGEVAGMDAGNTGFQSRANLFAESASREFLGPLDIDIFKTLKNFPPNLRIDIKLYRASNTFTIQHDNFAIPAVEAPPRAEIQMPNLKINLQQVKLYLRHEEHLDSVMNAIHQTSLLGYNYKLPYKFMTIKTDICQANQTSFTRDDICLGLSPIAAAITFVPSDAFIGTFGTTPYNFTAGANIQSAYLSVNGRKLAFENPLSLDLGHNQFYQAYHSLLMFCGQHMWYQSGLIFPPDEFVTGNFILGCSNVRDLDNENRTIEPPENGTTKIQINWGEGGPGVITQIIMVLLFDVTTEISPTGQIIMPINL